jgi:capsular polysaccharide export protein
VQGAQPLQNGAPSVERARLLYLSAGFLYQRRIRDILHAAGYDLAFGPLTRPRSGDSVVVWGKSPSSARGVAFAAKHGLPVIRVEDAFMRSVGLGARGRRGGARPLGLIIDPIGVHFDASAPSLLEHILAKNPLDDAPLLARAKAGMARLRALDISKYNLHDPALPAPAPGYVLVIDQTRGDASITHGGADGARFAQMLDAARADYPSARIVIKSHPETMNGLRAGHFGAADCDARTVIFDQNASPWALLEGAIAVYTVTSQLGMEAIFAGHRPQVFGLPFYAGWGLTDDRISAPRRARRLTKAQLFAAAYLLGPTWFNPHTGAICSFETAVDVLQARLRSYREDGAGYVALGMRAWKRGRLQAVFGAHRPMVFKNNIARAGAIARQSGRRVMVWGAGDAPPDMHVLRVEDGLLRSRGLGAALTPPISLICDDIGIYYNSHGPSAFEALMMQHLPADARARAAAFLDALLAGKLSKYNLPQTGALVLPPAAQGRRRVLVAGQVADDASIALGGARLTNLDVLRAARMAHPDGFIIYKPHPDVEAGLRAGAISAADMAALADMGAAYADPIAAIEVVDEVFTQTSTLGFEALIRGREVTCLGAPFYAGWGLTRDMAGAPQRRLDYVAQLAQRGGAKIDVLHLVHAALIAYPRYYDPQTRRPCPPEIALLRLMEVADHNHSGSALLRLLSKLQGRFASYAHWWR